MRQAGINRFLKDFTFAALACITLATLPHARAQAGGGGAGGGAGAGAGSGASGPGAAAAAHGTANGNATPAQQGQQAAQNGLTPQQYAAGASPIVDPRKAPPSRPGALTLQQVVDLARAKNPTLLAADQTLRSVRAQEIQAGVRANPYFTFYGANVTLPGDGSLGNPYSYSAQVSRLFERGNKRGFRLDNARATSAQTQAQNEDQIRQTILQVKNAFTNMLIAKQAVTLSEANLKEYQHEVEIGQERYQAGDLGKLDYERLDLQLGQFESDESNNIVNLQQASQQLQTLVGYDSPRPDFDIMGEVVPPVLAQTKDAVVQAALATRPDLRAAQFAIQANEANARLARSNGLTDPTLEGEYDRSGYYNSAGFSLNIPLRFFDRNQGNIETARFQADASRFTAVAARNQVVSDVEQAWIGYSQSKRLSDRFSSHYLDESTDVLQIAQFAFEHGGLALIDYLDALRDARATVSSALNAYQNTWLAIHQLSAAAGTELAP